MRRRKRRKASRNAPSLIRYSTIGGPAVRTSDQCRCRGSAQTHIVEGGAVRLNMRFTVFILNTADVGFVIAKRHTCQQSECAVLLRMCYVVNVMAQALTVCRTALQHRVRSMLKSLRFQIKKVFTTGKLVKNTQKYVVFRMRFSRNNSFSTCRNSSSNIEMAIGNWKILSKICMNTCMNSTLKIYYYKKTNFHCKKSFKIW